MCRGGAAPQAQPQVRRAHVLTHTRKTHDIEPNTQHYSRYATTEPPAKCQRVLVNILCNDIDMGIDTQSSVNAISVEKYEKMDI